MKSLKLTKLSNLSVAELSDLLICDNPAAKPVPTDVILDGANQYYLSRCNQLSSFLDEDLTYKPFDQHKVYVAITRLADYVLEAKYCIDNTDYHEDVDGFKYPSWELYSDVYSVYAFFNEVKYTVGDPSISQRYFLLFAQTAHARLRIDFSFLNDSEIDYDDGIPRFTKSDLMLLSELTASTIKTYGSKFGWDIDFDNENGYLPNNLKEFDEIPEIENFLIGLKNKSTCASVKLGEALRWLTEHTEFKQTNFYNSK